MKDFKQRVSSLAKNYVRDICYDKLDKAKAKFSSSEWDKRDKGDFNIDDKVVESDKKIQVLLEFSGQKFFTMEFGKGADAGEGNDYALGSKEQLFRSGLYNYPGRNPLRRASRTVRVKVRDDDDNVVKEDTTINVTNKYGTKFQKRVEKAKTKTIVLKNSRWDILSRPGKRGYYDMDGEHHVSAAKGIFNIDKIGKKRVSHYGLYAISKAFKYNFLRNKSVGSGLFAMSGPGVSEHTQKFKKELRSEIINYLLDGKNK